MADTRGSKGNSPKTPPQARSPAQAESLPGGKTPPGVKTPPGAKTPPKESKLKGKLKQQDKSTKAKVKTGPCPWLCNLVPIDLPHPHETQTVLHPRKDVFILKVAKVGANGDRRCKMELELVTPKGPEKQALCRIDTRETQCDPEPPPCTCCTRIKKKRKHS